MILIGSGWSELYAVVGTSTLCTPPLELGSLLGSAPCIAGFAGTQVTGSLAHKSTISRDHSINFVAQGAHTMHLHQYWKGLYRICTGRVVKEALKFFWEECCSLDVLWGEGHTATRTASASSGVYLHKSTPSAFFRCMPLVAWRVNTNLHIV